MDSLTSLSHFWLWLRNWLIKKVIWGKKQQLIYGRNSLLMNLHDFLEVWLRKSLLQVTICCDYAELINISNAELIDERNVDFETRDSKIFYNQSGGEVHFNEKIVFNEFPRDVLSYNRILLMWTWLVFALSSAREIVIQSTLGNFVALFPSFRVFEEVKLNSAPIWWFLRYLKKTRCKQRANEKANNCQDRKSLLMRKLNIQK